MDLMTHTIIYNIVESPLRKKMLNTEEPTRIYVQQNATNRQDNLIALAGGI